MPSNLTGPGKPTATHSQANLNRRQSAARIQDANASTHPNQTTVAEVQARRP